MGASDRVKRPVLQRTNPIRSWSTLFGVPRDEAEGEGSVSAGTSSQPEPSPQSLNEVISRSVSLGYRVVDEYIQQGQRAAERLRSRSYGAETMADDVQDLTVRMLRYASDFAAVWLDFVQLAAGNQTAPQSAAAAPGAEGPAPETAGKAAAAPPSSVAPQAPERASVRIEVIATQPTEVSLDLQPDAGARPLLLHALRAVDPDKPRLTEVSFEPASGGQSARFRIRVPNGQPPGHYRGLIIDEQTSRPVGSVGVRIGAE
jgi:hypothetical protein